MMDWQEDEPITVPDEIYLQLSDLNGDPAGEVTWCVDRINDDDVTYVKKATVNAKLAAAELMAEACGVALRSEGRAPAFEVILHRVFTRISQALAAWKAAQ